MKELNGALSSRYDLELQGNWPISIGPLGTLEPTERLDATLNELLFRIQKDACLAEFSRSLREKELERQAAALNLRIQAAMSARSVSIRGRDLGTEPTSEQGTVALIHKLEGLGALPLAEFEIKQQRVLSFDAGNVDLYWQPSIFNSTPDLQEAPGLEDGLATEPGDAVSYDRVEYWYWCSVLTDTYTNRQNEYAVVDTNSLLRWLDNPTDGSPFSTREGRVFADDGYSSKATLLRTSDETRVGTDIGLYLLQFVTAMGGRDLLTNQPLNVQKDTLQDHHLIPLATATSVGQSSTEIRKGKSKLAELLNSPLNRAYVLKSTNLTIGSKNLQNYIRGIEPSTKSSLYLTIDTDYVQNSSDFESYARDALSGRFDQIKSAAVNHLMKLRH